MAFDTRALSRGGTGGSWGRPPSRPAGRKDSAGPDRELEVDPDFAEVPLDVLSEDGWYVVGGWPWADQEDILMLEGRALCSGVMRQVMCTPCRNLRLLVFADNLVLVLCLDRYRTRRFSLLVVLRRIAATLLLFNVRLTVRWIPSEL